MSTPAPSENLAQKNRRTGRIIFVIVLMMIGLAYASVPLYNLFCSVTGFGGTTQVAASLPDTILDRKITVRFNADVNNNLAWDFKPEARRLELNVGQEGMISYIAENRSNAPLTGTALYNVTPPKAGKYFHKTQCFCFGEQTLQPGEKTNMPVLFFIDPSIADDHYMDDVKSITLSYTFFKAETDALENALEIFYNE